MHGILFMCVPLACVCMYVSMCMDTHTHKVFIGRYNYRNVDGYADEINIPDKKQFSPPIIYLQNPSIGFKLLQDNTLFKKKTLYLCFLLNKIFYILPAKSSV